MGSVREVVIEGDGVAAVCCARLLQDASVPCRLMGTQRPKLAAVLLGEATQAMLREIFPGGEGEPDLFEGFPVVRRRIVQWGAAAEAVAMPHRGVVVAEAELLRRLWQRVDAMPAAPSLDTDGWAIVSSGPGMLPVANLCFGSRRASLCSTELRPEAGEEACWVESVPSGWLFALALGAGRATLISVGAGPEVLLGESRLIASVVLGRLGDAREAAAYPRMLESFTDGLRLACGSAAMAFDPLCGEGTGNAVREAFLAAAAVRAAMGGGDAGQLAAHYGARLRQGFYRHLEICRGFYSTGGVGEFWSAECEALESGMRSLRARMQGEGEPRYRLMDRNLVPLRP